MARILLVKTGRITPKYFLVTPPLGIMYLASVLRNAGHEVRIADMRAENLGKEAVLERARRFSPDIIGFSCLTPEAGVLAETATFLREHLPGVKFVSGGPHATSYPREVLKQGLAEAVVLGEGEVTFPRLVEAWGNGTAVTTLPGVASLSDGQVVINQPEEHICDLDALPFPAWDLVDLQSYWNQYTMTPMGKRKYMAVVTSRGCPYRCIYCHNLFGKTMRARSPESVMRELRFLVNEVGITEFEFIDDIFNFDADRAKRICDLIKQEDLRIKITFPNALRGDLLDEELLVKLKQAGTYFVSFAVEAASPRIQKLIRKNLRVEKVRDSIRMAASLGLFTNGFFMLGFPTETREEMQQTIDFAVNSNLHTASFFLVTAFAGTELGRLVPEEKLAFDFTNYDFSLGRMNLTDLPDSELFALQRQANWRFYLRPRRLTRIIRDYPDPQVFAKFGVYLLRRLAKR